MFDGSHRTNKREINLAGASASSRSSRKTHLNVARQQRLARAQAKAKVNGAKCLQRSWRGSRGRKMVAMELDTQFQAMMQGPVGDNPPTLRADERNRNISSAASLLAFRMSPALLPFFTANSDSTASVSLGKKEWGAEDCVSEKHLRWDILLLQNVIQRCRGEGSGAVVSAVAAKRIVSVVLVLLRQSFRVDSENKFEKHKEEGNGSLVELLDYLLESSFSPPVNGVCSAGILTRNDGNLWTSRPSDHYMGILRFSEATPHSTNNGWMINLFLCFRDFTSFYDNASLVDKGSGSPMDVDGSDENNGEVEMKKLLKWCCHIIFHLEALDQKQLQQTTTPLMHPLMYQQGLALLASILFSSCSLDEGTWINEQLNQCLMKLEESMRGSTARGAVISPLPSTPWCLILIHFLSAAMCSLSSLSFPSNVNRSSDVNRKVPGLMPCFSPNLPISGNASSKSHPWMEALRDTLTSRESVVMSQVLSQANASQKTLDRSLLTYAIPTILQYTLQHQPELAILTSFVAQGENIESWFAGKDAQVVGLTGVNFLPTVAAAAAYDGEDVEEESDEDEQDALPKQQNKPTKCDSTINASGRYSRQDLQTLPKLDVLYQTGALRAKKRVVDRLCSTLPNYSDHVRLLVTLAEKVGKGDWIQQLGNTLFSSTQSSPSFSCPLLAPLPLQSWQRQAQVAYTGALSTIMTTCSGIKAGRNAGSPLLARLAFHEPFLYGLWERSSQNASLLTSQSLPSKAMDSSMLSSVYEVFASFCDTFSHHLLAVNDDDFLKRYHQPELNDRASKTAETKDHIIAKDIVLTLTKILNDLYWVRPVLASDINNAQNDPASVLRFQRARLFLSGTKLWNSLYERWCRLYRVAQFCDVDCWWFPHLASRGRHDNNPIIQSQVTTLADQENDAMDDSSVESANMDDVDEAAPLSPNDAGGDALASTFRDPKMARVLTYIPQAMPFSRRVNLFNSLLESDKQRTQDETASFRQMIMNLDEGEEAEITARERVTIRRDELYSDSKQRLNQLGKRLRKRVQVTFVNKHGQEEAGIDGGGVFKEFLDDLIKDAFLPQTVREQGGGGEDGGSSGSHPDFFSVTPLQTLKVNTTLDGNDAIFSSYEFLGRVLGKAIYESILVEPQFCLPFLNKLLGKQNSLDDLKSVDPEYYKNLKSLRHMSAQEIYDLGLTFELHDSATTTIELMPGGCAVPVTKENVIQYIHLVSHQKMNVRGSRQTSAFLRGFRDIIPAQWVRLFSANELQKLISGDDAVKGIDVHGMMSVMRYSGGLHPSQPIVQWLWKVVKEMTPGQQRKFLKFMTSCSRQPLLGFGSMVPAPCIQQTRLREDDHVNDISEGLGTGNIRLPTSSTCMNLLKLPKYTSEEMLREKLLYAIESASGFELS